MNELVRRPIDGEVLPPDATVRVIGKLHPLNGGRVACDLPAGLSIGELVAEAIGQYRPKMRTRRDLVVELNGHPIPEANWDKVRPKKGTTLTFRLRPQGGGDSLKLVLGLAVAVSALIIAPYLAPGIVSAFAAAGITLSTSVATAFASGAIILAGTLALNALFPTRPTDAIDAGGVFNSIQGAQNQANPFGAIPVVLGRHRQSPVYAAKPYTEIVGDDQYLRLLFCVGYGPIQIDNIQIGETPIGNFSDVQIETRQGIPADSAPTLYPGEVDEQQIAVGIENAIDPPAFNGGNGPWSDSLFTAANTDEISVDFTATKGINAKDPQGDDVTWPVTAGMRYRQVGTVGWSGETRVTFTRSFKPSRLGIVLSVPRAQYEVQTHKVTGAGNPDFTADTIVWTALRSIKQAVPISFPKPLSLIALRIRATDQLNGLLNTLNCISTSLVTAFDGTTWNGNTHSQNPADLFRHVLQGPANARPVTDDHLDLDSLQSWWLYCEINHFQFNQIITSAGSVFDKLCDITAAGRGVPTFIDGKWGVIWDRPDDDIVQHFTPRNSWGFQGQRAYAQQPHGWRVSFINEANGFTEDERIVYDDGFDSSNATLFEGVEFPGVTNPDLIWKHGRFHIAQSRLRPETLTLNVGWENLICTRGDRVKVTHDALLIGLGAGRVKAVSGQNVTFDEVLTIDDGKTYGIEFRLPGDVRSIERAVDESTAAGEYTTLTLVGDLSAVTPGVLFAFGETERESAIYRIKGISPQQDVIATLTLVDDAPDISQADTGSIPAYDPHVTIPADPFSLPPRNLQLVEIVDGQGESVRDLARLSWQLPRLGRVTSFEVQARDDDAAGRFITVATIPIPSTTADVNITTGGVWSFQVRCLFDDGTVSTWAQLLAQSLHGLTFPPDDVTNLHEHLVDGQTVLDWTIVADRRILFYEVRKGTSWDTGLVVGDAVAQPPWPTTGDGTYHVRAYVISPFGARIYSANEASITISGSILSRNIIETRDEQTTGWTGGLDGGVIDGSFIRTDIAHSITLPWSQEIVDDLALSGNHIAVYVSSTIVDIGEPNECRFWTLFEADGIEIGEDFLGETDVLGSGDILGAASTRFIRAFPIWRFADGDDIDVFAPGDIFSPPDIFSADVNWGDWTQIASGTRKSRYFQPGFVLITDDEGINATGTKFSWFVDVPDRQDNYTNLTIPDTGFSLVFYKNGYDATPLPGTNPLHFNGGPNGAIVPQILSAIVNPTNGDAVKITSLTADGCTLNVVNAGSNVTRSGVNIFAVGF